MEPNTTPPQSTPPAGPSGYGKRPKWQWVLLYIILAIIVYGAIYLIFFHKSGTGSSNSGY